MYSTYDNTSSLLVWLVWIHFAIMLVPVMIFTITIELQEAKAHRKLIQNRPLRPQRPTLRPMRV